MFDFLFQVSTEQAIASVHYAIRLIKHIKQIKNAQEGFRVAGLASEPSSEEVELARRIISEIREREQTTLGKLSEHKAQEYIQLLADMLQNLLKESFQYDEMRGRELLEELRQTTFS